MFTQNQILWKSRTHSRRYGACSRLSAYKETLIALWLPVWKNVILSLKIKKIWKPGRVGHRKACGINVDKIIWY